VGKLDRKALPLPTLAAHQYQAPSNEIEEKLVTLWADVLKLNHDRISINANFFELGGHSLAIVRLNTRINEWFNRDISVAAMFKLPTISSIAEYLLRGDQSRPDALAATIEEDLNDADRNLKLIEDLLN
jgi:acyl carrier protein